MSLTSSSTWGLKPAFQALRGNCPVDSYLSAHYLMSAHQLPIGFTIMNKAYRKLLKSKDFYKKSEKSLHFSSSLGTK